MRQFLTILSAFLLCLDALSVETPAFYNVVMPRDKDVSMVACLEQDSEGSIWIGTNCGIFSYDGYAMAYHSRDLAGGHVYCLKDIPGDALYAGTEHGLWAFDYSSGRFRPWLEGSPQGVRSMVYDSGKLWIGCETGLFQYNPAHRDFRKIESGRLRNEVIYSLVKASDGNLYIGTYDGMYYYDRQRGHFRNIQLPLLPGRNNVFVNVLLEDESRQCLWIGTGGRLYRYGLTTNRLSIVPELEGNSIKSLSLFKGGRLLIGTDNGLYVYNEGSVVHIQHDSSKGATSLINDVVWSILVDGDGRAWFGTDEGISILQNDRGFTFTSVAEITGQTRGNHFNQILRDSHGRLWLGGSEGLILTTPDFKEARWFNVDQPSARIAHNRIRRIYEDREGGLWICTDGGIHYWKDTHWEHINLYDSGSGRNTNWAYDICEDGLGRMWIASFMGGLMVVDRQKLISSHGDCQADAHILLEGGSGLSPFQILNRDAESVYVLYYHEGMHRFNARTFEEMQDDSLVEQLQGDRPGRLFADSKNRLWIGLEGKLLCAADSGMTSYPLSNCPSGPVSWITEVDGAIWFGSKLGEWTIEDGIVRSVDAIEESADNAFYDPRERTLYLGTNDGIYHGVPQRASNDSIHHPVQLTEVTANNRIVKGLSSEYTFAPDERHIDFKVMDRSFGKTENVTFQYRLKGIDSSWYPLPKGSNVITFNNLPYGEYELEVSRLGKADHEDDMLSVPFSIRYPWYMRWWAVTLYVLAGLLFVGWCFRFYRTRSRLEFERQEKEHILEQIQLKRDFLTRLSEELKGPLGNILSPVSKMLSETRDVEMGEQMRIVQDEAENLFTVIGRMSDFSHPETDAAALVEPASSLSEPDERFLQEVNGILEAHISDSELNVQALCEKMGFGSKYVYRKMKQLTGKTPVEYIRSFRLNMAATLLKQRKYTVTEVMYLIGFSNASYFSKCFQAEFGCSPREFMDREP